MAKKLVSNETKVLCLLTEILDGHVDSETTQALINNSLNAPHAVMPEHEDADTIEVRLVAEVVLHVSGTGRSVEGPQNVALDVSINEMVLLA